MTASNATAREARRRILRAVAERLGHRFADLDLLDRALCHSSTGNEGRANYERLEFLGDAFLNFAVADHLFRTEPESKEGSLTTTRAAIVSRRPLAAVARKLELVRALEVGKGLRESELDSERILADLTEAVLGAIYLDGGVRAARAFVRRHLLKEHSRPEPDAAEMDPKTRLLHWCQHHKLGQPRYELLGTSGLQHQQEFRAAVRLADGRTASGRCRTKRGAEKRAADALLAALQREREERAG